MPKVITIFGISHKMRSVVLPALGVAYWAVLNALLINKQHMLGAMFDSQAHMVLGRLPIDSLTPGIYQADLQWHTVLHVLLLPFMAIPGVFGSQFAAVPLLATLFTLSVVLLFAIVRGWTGSSLAAFTSACMLALNPYILFFAVNPMSEQVLFFLIVSGAYCFYRWCETQDINFLGLLGLFSSIAVMARPEGLGMVIASSSVVLGYCFFRRMPWPSIWASVFVTLITSLPGTLMRFASSLVDQAKGSFFFGNDNVATATVDASLLRNIPSFFDKCRIIWAGLEVQIGLPLIIISLGCLVLIVIPGRQTLKRCALLCLAASPLLLIVAMVLKGSVYLIVQDVFPVTNVQFRYLDIRYLLSAIISAAIVVGLVVGQMRQGNRLWKFLGTSLSALVLICSLWQYAYGYATNFVAIRESNQFYGGEVVQEWRDFEDHIYDDGHILMMFTRNYSVIPSSRLPLKTFINEYNYPYFEQAMKEPWLFARWIIASNQGDKILPRTKMGDVANFYDLVLHTEDKDYYRLNERALRKALATMHIDPMLVPSLNPQAEWDPKTIYQRLKDSK